MTDPLVENFTIDSVSRSQLYPFFKGISINFISLLKGVYILYPFFKGVTNINFTNYGITEIIYSSTYTIGSFTLFSFRFPLTIRK